MATYHFATFVPSTGTQLPVLVFSSGMLTNSENIKFLMQGIADKGFICVVPDRDNDLVGGGLRLLASVFCGVPLKCAIKTDGSHLMKAFEWVQGNEFASRTGNRADVSKIAVGGWSMGAMGAIKAAGQLGKKIGAMVIVSPSLEKANEKMMKFQTAEMKQIVKSLHCPSLWITSEGDFIKSVTCEYFDMSPTPKTMVVFKDSALDVSLPYFRAHTVWPSFPLNNIKGMQQHMALAAEEKDVTHIPVSAFLAKLFSGTAGIDAGSSEFAEVKSA